MPRLVLSLGLIVGLVSIHGLRLVAQNPTPAWPRHAIDDSLRGADGVKLADANGDGLLDIVTGWEESGTTKAYFHPGFSLVKRPWPSVVVGPSPATEDAGRQDGYRTFSLQFTRGTEDVILDVQSTYVIC